MSDLSKLIESLEKRIKNLESLKKDNIGMFGRSYSLIGTSNSDFLIKTKGQVKIQWGSKFIDLIKDGKLNVDSKIFYSVNSKESIGNKEGIYITPEEKVYLKIGSNDPIPLVGEIGTTYVSFLEEQLTNSDAKHTALKNIGFLYSSLEDIKEDSLLNGIIYIENNLKLYIVLDGKLSEFTIEFPNPFTEQFVIAKNDNSKGSLFIKGQGINNSLAFDSFYIFSEEGNAYLSPEQSINIVLQDKSYFTLDKDKTRIDNTLEVKSIKSIGANNSSGFMFYETESGITLIVDNIIERNKLKGEVTNYIDPIEWSYKRNIITDIKFVTDEETNEEYYVITLKYENNYKINDQLYFYIEDNNKSLKVPVKVLMINTDTSNGIYVKVIEELLSPELTSFDKILKCIGRVISLVGSDEQITTIRQSEKAIDVVECLTIEEESNITSVITRQGNLTELNLKERNKEDIPIEGNGIYSKQGYFLLAGYTNTYELPDDDNSTRFASTEWVNKKLSPPQDEDIIPDPNLIYFVASGSAVCSIPDSQSVPMGFIGIIKEDGTTLVNIGKSNYAVESFNEDNSETGDIRGQIPQSTRTILINALKDAKSGVIPSISGLPDLFCINKSDISTIPENSMHKVKSSKNRIDPSIIFADSKIKVRSSVQSTCRWTNNNGDKYNTVHPGTDKSIRDIDFWRNDLNIRILAGSILCEIFKSVPNVDAISARNAVYSDSVGFALSWNAAHWENFNFFLMLGVCETNFVKPTDDSNNAKAGLRMNNNISIICNSTRIYGEFDITYRDYKWPESPDSNYSYLSAAHAIDDMIQVNEMYRLPYPINIRLNLIFNGMNENYKIEGIVGSNVNITTL